MREPTVAEVRKFRAAAQALADLGAAGFHIYLAASTLHLLVGDSHDVVGNRLVQRQDHSRAHVQIPRSGGGDW